MRPWGPPGFLLMMIGFGLRLDTPWQALAWVCLAAGAALAGIGLAGRGGDGGGTFVRRRAGE